MITKPQQHDIDRAGKRLLRKALESLGWVVNDVQEDYSVDSNVQVFDKGSPTGAWFHVQLKSSASSDYSSDRSFISQELLVDHARHYALEILDPVFLLHADVTSEKIYWLAIQLDDKLPGVLQKTGATYARVRIPTRQELPETAPELLIALNDIRLTLAARVVTSAPIGSFEDAFRHMPNQEALHRAFQEKMDALKLRKIVELFERKEFDQCRPRIKALLGDPDTSVETKFWAQVQFEGVDYAETVHAGKPQSELPRLILEHAKSLQKLTAAGPKYLKFYSLIARKAAELGILVHENISISMALHQQLEKYGSPMMALGLYARRSAITGHIVAKYNQCLRLARYASNYRDRWVLGRALTNIVNAIAGYLITLDAERQFEIRNAFAQSALRICKVAAWICNETGDSQGAVLAILSSLMTTQSTDSDAYEWAVQSAISLVDADVRADALLMIERAAKRWKGEHVEGDYRGDTVWQVIQNMATALGIDTSNENDPLVKGLRIAARDNSPERVLAHCEHILVSLGATGPIARQIRLVFNLGTAGSKVVHCTIHDYHIEGKDQDTAFEEFRKQYCDSCPDRKPRPKEWRLTPEEEQVIQNRHQGLVSRLAGTHFGRRYTNED